MNVNIYRLRADSDIGIAIQPDIGFFQKNFIGKPLGTHWTPPKFKLLNQSKPVRDFVSWMLSAPVVSQRARNALLTHLGDRVEFLQLGKVKNNDLYAINVLNKVDCLDVAKSDVLFSDSDPARILSVHRYSFDLNRFQCDPIIFKIPEGPGEVFVTDSFVRIVVENKLSGVLLVRPEANPLATLISNSKDVYRPV